MTATLPHTPLEAFLTFQSLHILGTQQSTFLTISENLKKNEFVRQDESYEHDRLSPESLKQLYLTLLKDEARNEQAIRHSPIKHDDHEPKKRKLSSPRLPSLDGDDQSSHLLPEIVSRLFTRYQERAIAAIHELERNFRSVQNDIQEIDAGESDERRQQDVEPRRASKGVSSIQTLLRHDEEEVVQDTDSKRQRATTSDSTAAPSHHRSQSAVFADTYGRPPVIGSGTSGQQPLEHSFTRFDSGILSEVGVHSQTLPSSAAQQTFPHPPDANQSLTRQHSQSTNSYLPPLGFAVSSPMSDVHRRPPHPPAPLGALPPSASPRLNQPSLIPAERSAGSPIILPPPPGMLRSSGSPVGPLDALADMAGQQYRSNSSLPSPRQGQTHNIPPLPNHLLQPHSLVQRQWPYYENQTPYQPSSFPPYGQSPKSPYQPYGPPYPSPGPNLGSGVRQGHASQYQTSIPPYPHHHGFPPGHSNYDPSPPLIHVQQNQHFKPPLPSTPIPPRNESKPLPQLSPINTSVSATKWKVIHLTGSVVTPGSPTPPQPGDISPISEKASSPVPGNLGLLETAGPDTVEKRATPEVSVLRVEDSPVLRSPRVKRRGGRQQGRKSRGRSANSTASVADSVRNHTRSQSAISNTDELALLETNVMTSRKIKPEPPATPAAVAMDDNMSTISAIGDRTSGRRRRRGNTLRSPVRPSAKRKRTGTVEATPDIPPVTPFHKPNHVFANRYFSRISAPVMNDVMTHRLASMFAKPLTEREAPGYKDIIYRPQDLKSIKSAISAGSRTVAAIAGTGTAEEAGSPAAGSGRGSANLWVEKSLDVLPPKGIVNSAQLEKEICRMFANAVMFNPDPKRGAGSTFRKRARRSLTATSDRAGTDDDLGEEDGSGVVKDTREMFEDVERRLAEWRAAERIPMGEDDRKHLGTAMGGEGGRDDDDVDELAGEDGDVGVSPVRIKRRRRI